MGRYGPLTPRIASTGFIEVMAVQAVRPVPTALPNPGLAVDRYGGFGQRWLDGMWRGDPLADGVVADGARTCGARSPKASKLSSPARGAGRPVRRARHAPGLDGRRSLRPRGGHLARQSREYGLVLGAASLLAGAQNTIAGKPLTFTGLYEESAGVRSIEVGSWLMAVTTPASCAVTALDSSARCGSG